MQIYFHSRLWSYLPRVPILVEDTVYLFFIKWIKCDSKACKGVIKDFSVLLNFLFIKESWKIPQNIKQQNSFQNW